MSNNNWRHPQVNILYSEKRFENDKIGHTFHHHTWKAFYDGIFVGGAATEDDAKMMVDQFHLSWSKNAKL